MVKKKLFSAASFDQFLISNVFKSKENSFAKYKRENGRKGED